LRLTEDLQTAKRLHMSLVTHRATCETIYPRKAATDGIFPTKTPPPPR